MFDNNALKMSNEMIKSLFSIDWLIDQVIIADLFGSFPGKIRSTMER